MITVKGELERIINGINIIVTMAIRSNTPVYAVEWWLSKDVVNLLELYNFIDKRTNTLYGIEVAQVIVNDSGKIELKYKNRGAR